MKCEKCNKEKECIIGNFYVCRECESEEDDKWEEVTEPLWTFGRDEVYVCPECLRYNCQCQFDIEIELVPSQVRCRYGPCLPPLSYRRLILTDF